MGLLPGAGSLCSLIPWGSTFHSELSPPTSTMNQEAPSRGLPPGQCDGGTSIVEVPLPR